MREGGEKVDILVAKKEHIQLTEAQAVKCIAHIIISPSIAPADITNLSLLLFLSLSSFLRQWTGEVLPEVAWDEISWPSGPWLMKICFKDMQGHVKAQRI